MSSLLTHIFIPLFILLIFSEEFKLSKKIILFLCFFAILPDLDIFLFHRATLHNIFVLLVPLCIYILWKSVEFIYISSFYIFSHIILDLFNQGVYIFYPFYNKVIYLIVGVSYNNDIILPIHKFIIETDLSTEFIERPMISAENIVTIILIIIMLVISMINKHKSLNTKDAI